MNILHNVIIYFNLISTERDITQLSSTQKHSMYTSSKKMNQQGYVHRGPKEILNDTLQTRKFYTKVLTISNITYLLIQVLIFWESFTSKYMLLFGLTSGLSWSALLFVRSLDLTEKDLYMGPDGDINDIVLYIYSHMPQNIRETIMFALFVQFFSLFSNYSWYLLLMVPISYLLFQWQYYHRKVMSSPDKKWLLTNIYINKKNFLLIFNSLVFFLVVNFWLCWNCSWQYRVNLMD